LTTASPSRPTLYDFYFTYKDYEASGAARGNYYYGTVVDDGTFGYGVGQNLINGIGTYHIYKIEGATGQAVGTVRGLLLLLWSGQWSGLHTVLLGSERALAVSGVGGLGNDFDYIVGSDGSSIFSSSNEANNPVGNAVRFLFHLQGLEADGATAGDYYYGKVADDGTFHYSAGQSIATALGTYHIYAAEGLDHAGRRLSIIISTMMEQAVVAPTHRFTRSNGRSPVSGVGGLGNDSTTSLAAMASSIFSPAPTRQ